MANVTSTRSCSLPSRPPSHPSSELPLPPHLPLDATLREDPSTLRGSTSRMSNCGIHPISEVPDSNIAPGPAAVPATTSSPAPRSMPPITLRRILPRPATVTSRSLAPDPVLQTYRRYVIRHDPPRRRLPNGEHVSPPFLMLSVDEVQHSPSTPPAHALMLPQNPGPPEPFEPPRGLSARFYAFPDWFLDLPEE